MRKIDINHPNIFDYANSKFKSSKNDILLINNSDAHIGTTSGITHLMLARDKPSLLINWSPFEYILKNDLSIILPKILKQKGKIFSINEKKKI